MIAHGEKHKHKKHWNCIHDQSLILRVKEHHYKDYVFKKHMKAPWIVHWGGVDYGRGRQTQEKVANEGNN